MVILLFKNGPKYWSQVTVGPYVAAGLLEVVCDLEFATINPPPDRSDANQSNCNWELWRVDLDIEPCGLPGRSRHQGIGGKDSPFVLN